MFHIKLLINSAIGFPRTNICFIGIFSTFYIHHKSAGNVLNIIKAIFYSFGFMGRDITIRNTFVNSRIFQSYLIHCYQKFCRFCCFGSSLIRLNNSKSISKIIFRSSNQSISKISYGFFAICQSISYTKHFRK